MSSFNSIQERIRQAQKQGKEDEETAQTLATKVQESVMLLDMTKGLTRAARERLKTDIEEAQKVLAENRESQNPTIRRAVVKALIGWYIHPQQLSSKEDAEKIVARLITDGLVQEDPKGTLAIIGKSYSVPPANFFEAEDIAEIEKQFEIFQGRFREVLKKTASLSIKNLLTGWKGTICLFIPPEKYSTPEGPRWRAGGTLILESDGRFIRPLEAIGKIETLVAEARKLEAKRLSVKIEVRSLTWKQPPLLAVKTDDGKLQNAKTQMLWYLCKRGLDAAAWTAKTSAMGTLTEKEFFLEGKSGTYFLASEEAWQETRPGKEMWISKPSMLIERLEKDSRRCIRIAEIPDHLTDWLAECRQPVPEGERFYGVNQPLQKLLRHYGAKAARNNEKEIVAVATQEVFNNLNNK